MRILLAVLHFGLLRNFESVIESLASRGHEVFLAAEEADTLGGRRLADALASRFPGVHLLDVPDLGAERGADLSRRLRVALDFFRFHQPEYAGAAKLRERLRERVPRIFVSLAERQGIARAEPWLSRLEGSLPVSPAATKWLRDLAPEAVLLASLTHYRSMQPEIQRAADAVQIPTAACIYSWDHLSSKALLRRAPQRVFVWNDVQAAEARELHGIPAHRIAVTGAQCYDQWFNVTDVGPRGEFCAGLGLDPAQPYLLYVCSALTPSPDEPGFVLDWLQRLRTSASPALNQVGVVIRPHPERLQEWRDVDISRWANVIVQDTQVIGDAAKAAYRNTVVHSAAVVGLVTSAFLEAAIAKRPVLTLSLPQFATHQQEMRHFRYLLEVADGLPAVAVTMADHLAQLDSVLNGDRSWFQRQERFVNAFVRPKGLDVPATPEFVREVEALAARKGTPHAAAERAGQLGAPRSLPRPIVSGLLTLSGVGPIRRALLDQLEWQHAKGKAGKAAVKKQKRQARRWKRLSNLTRRVLVRGSSTSAGL